MSATKLSWTGLQVVAALILGLACWRMLRAGTTEARGDLGAARGQARAAGFLGGIAALGTSAVWLFGPICRSVTVAALAAATGWTILLAGLSGKPRPSGAFAALLWLATAVLAVVVFLGC